MNGDIQTLVVYVCNCPSAGHDMIALDYRKYGKTCEPEVVHVDQELDFKITFLASNFEEFIIGLVHDDVFDTSTAVDVQYLWKPDDISFELKEAPLPSRRLMIELNQKLAPDETGWSRSRLNVPGSWKDATLKMNDKRIQIVADDKIYYIDKDNSGKLSFELLGADEMSDKDVEAIWQKYASEKTQ